MAAPFGFSTLCPALRQLFFNLMVVHTYMQHFLTFLSYLAPCSQPLEKNSSGHDSESDVMHNCYGLPSQTTVVSKLGKNSRSLGTVSKIEITKL